MIKRKFTFELERRLSAEYPLIQIILGPRQVGKTTGIQQVLKHYDDPYLFCSTDESLQPSESWLLEKWQSALLKGDGALLVIDEIQNLPNWSSLIKRLWDEQKLKKSRLKLVLLGSSSLSIKQGVDESLAGRYELMMVSHWNYAESRELTNMDLDTFLRFGGYPGSYQFISEPERWRNYVLKSIVDNVVDKDILRFSQIRMPALFRQAFEIICGYPSQEISYRKLLGQLQDKGNTDLVKTYLKLFEGAFLFKVIEKYSHQPHRQKSTSPKIISLAPCLYSLFSFPDDKTTFVFESNVGAVLLGITGDVYYWRLNREEVDFVVKWNNKVFAIEVKSGRKKSDKWLKSFQKVVPDAVPLIITRENFLDFSKDPKRFLSLYS